MPHGCNLPCHFRCWKTLESAALIQNVTFYHIQLLLLVQSFCRCNKSQRHPQTSRGRKRKNTHTHTFPLRLLELWHWSVALKQKQLVQPWGLDGSKKKEPCRQVSHLTPATFIYKHGSHNRRTRRGGQRAGNDFNQIEEKRKFKFKRNKKKKKLTLQRHLPVSGWHTWGVTPLWLHLQGRQSGKR